MDQDILSFQNRKKRRRILRPILGIALVAVFFALLWFALDRFVFKVRKMTFSPSSLYSEEELLAACRVEEGTRLFGVDKSRLEQSVRENLPFLTNIDVHLRIPDTVSVTFDEKMGEIALTLGNETFAVDADLTVLARIDGNAAPARLGLTADGVSRCIVGEKIEFFDASVPGILSDLVIALDEAGLLGTVRSLDLRDKFNLRMDYMGRFDVLLGENGDLDLKFAMVKRVLEELYDDDTGEIDISDPNNAYVRSYNRGATGNE